jgi:hypothetical protein
MMGKIISCDGTFLTFVSHVAAQGWFVIVFSFERTSLAGGIRLAITRP